MPIAGGVGGRCRDRGPGRTRRQRGRESLRHRGEVDGRPAVPRAGRRRLAGQSNSRLPRPSARRGPGQGHGRSPAEREDRLLMAKPATLDGYSDQYTLDCERVLVTLLRGLGPWKDSVYLVGGLTPRYLVPAR